MVEQAVFDADPGLMEYILRAMVGGYGYESLRTKYDISGFMAAQSFAKFTEGIMETENRRYKQ